MKFMAFSTRFIFGFVTSFRDPDLDFAKQLPGDFDLIFSQVEKQYQTFWFCVLDFMIELKMMTTFWLSKWTNGYKRWDSHHLEVLHHQCEERWRWSRWRRSKLRLGCFSWSIRSKVKDGDWVTWYPNYKKCIVAHWRWKLLDTSVVTYILIDILQHRQIKRQVLSFLNSVARP